jgi:hypothetical protein
MMGGGCLGITALAPCEAPIGVALSARHPRLVSGGVTVGTDVGGVMVGTDMVGGLNADCGRADLINLIMDAPFWSIALLFDRMVASILASPASIVASIVVIVAIIASIKNS